MSKRTTDTERLLLEAISKFCSPKQMLNILDHWMKRTSEEQKNNAAKRTPKED